jgi:threonine dehydrogenase-like Zn-dependent dehydrogenase
MKAVVWKGDRTLAIETVEDACIEAPTDVLMHISSTASVAPISMFTRDVWAR